MPWRNACPLTAAERRRDECRAVSRPGRARQLNLLDGLRPPTDVEDLAGRVDEARARVAATEEAEKGAIATLDRARDDRLTAGDRGPLERWQRAHEEQPAVEQRAGKAAADLERARQRATAAAAAHGRGGPRGRGPLGRVRSAHRPAPGRGAP